MSVYVDELRQYSRNQIQPAARYLGTRWAHLTADSEEELHVFARRLGLRREWFQDGGGVAHYDLVPRRYATALQLGALFVPAREQARRRLEASR